MVKGCFYSLFPFVEEVASAFSIPDMRILNIHLFNCNGLLSVRESF
jgi:hypothetical protein